MNDELLARIEVLEQQVQGLQAARIALMQLVGGLLGNQPHVAQAMLDLVEDMRRDDLYVDLPDAILESARRQVEALAARVVSLRSQQTTPDAQ